MKKTLDLEEFEYSFVDDFLVFKKCSGHKHSEGGGAEQPQSIVKDR
jgi:hypothetical protein